LQDKLLIVENKLLIVEDYGRILQDKLLIVQNKLVIVRDNLLIVENKLLILHDKLIIFEDKFLIVEANLLIRKDFRLKHEKMPGIWPKSRGTLSAPGRGGGARLLTSRLARTLAPPKAGSGLPALPQRAPSWRNFARMPLACLTFER
jgi:hypothetical protein